jgi:MFS family permease
MSDHAIASNEVVMSRHEFGAKGIFAAVLGNAFEFYDFTIYAVYSAVIGAAFFPSADKFTSLLAAVATFGVGFAARPIGGLVIGAFGDHAGRKPAMMLTIGLMALGSGMIGLIPSYAHIGVFAPILLVIARLIQGFSAGGEMGPATMFMLESAPPGKRYFYGSWQMASQNISSIVVAIGGVLLATLTTTTQDPEGWGWRIPFLLGVLIAPVGMYIRNQLDETHEASVDGPGSGGLMAALFTRYWRGILLGIGMICGGTITQYFMINMKTFATTTLKLSENAGFVGTLMLGITGTLGALAGGIAADRYGLKAVGLVPRLLLLVLAFPLMLLLVNEPSVWTLMLFIGVLMPLNAASSAAIIILMPYVFAKDIRSTGLSFTYAAGVTLFGGTAILVVDLLVEYLHDSLAGAYYMIAANIVLIICLLLVKSTEKDSNNQLN